MGKTQGTGRQRDPGGGLGLAGATADADSTRKAAKPGPAKAYRATDRGYANGRVIEPGEVFTTRAAQGSWMEPLKGSRSYDVEEAVDDALAPHPDDPDLEGMSKAALEALAADAGVSQPGKLGKDDLITAIRAQRGVNAQ